MEFFGMRNHSFIEFTAGSPVGCYIPSGNMPVLRRTGLAWCGDFFGVAVY